MTQTVYVVNKARFKLQPLLQLAFILQLAQIAKYLKLFIKGGRGGRIRTYDPLYPKQVRYQTAPRPGPCASLQNCF